MVKRRRYPSRGAVARLARLREPTRDVVGAFRSLKILEVTTRAIRRQIGVLPAGMALCARDALVGTGKRKSRGGVIEFRIEPRGGAMTLRTRLRKSTSNVIRTLCSVVIVEMAAHAIGRRPFILPAHMTLLARQRGVGSRKRKPG
jgi:hypothetical protein